MDVLTAVVRRLNSKMSHVERWIHGPGAHHATSSRTRAGAGVTQKHRQAHRATMLVRERFAKDLLKLLEAVKPLGKYRNTVSKAEKLARRVKSK
jgi:hypothetical protein